MKRTKYFFLSLSIILLVVLGCGLGFYIVKQTKPQYVEGNIVITAIIDYGSLRIDNYEEHNVTILNGSTALQVFMKIADLDIVNYTFGSYIRGVNGYKEQLPNYWAFHYFKQVSQTWYYSEVGVSAYYVQNGGKIKLAYTG